MIYWLGLGGNLGNPVAQMRQALSELDERGVEVESVSGVYRTSPLGGVDQPEFLNAACSVRYAREPPGLLAILKAVERDLGRSPQIRWAPRLIDLDILLWAGGRWNEPQLVVPHPALRDRRFALEPLLALDPGLTMPDGTPLERLVEPLRRDLRQRVDPMVDVSLR